MKAIDLTKTIPINIMLFNNNTLESLCLDLSFTLATTAPTDSDKDLEQARLDQNVSFTKIITFIDCVLKDSVVYARQDTELVEQIFGTVENNFIALTDVSEMVLIAALHCKFNNMISDHSMVSTVTMKEKIQDMQFNYTFLDEGEGYTELPGKSEWCPELSYWDEPWWMRADIITIDKIAKSQEELEKWQSTDMITVEESSKALFDQIDQQYKDMFSEDDVKQGELVEIDFEQKSGLRLVD
jgi:hypothetical protein